MKRSQFATLCAPVLAALSCSPAPAGLVCDLPSGTASLPSALREASGAAITADQRLWIIADSGEPVLFAVNDANEIVDRVRVLDMSVDDWEDLARGPCGDGGDCLFIGEIGDNLHRQQTRRVLRVRVPSPGDSVATAERFPFRFPDGPSDAEALAALPDGSIIVITKGRNRAIGVYRYPLPLRPDEVVTLEPVGELSRGIVQLPLQATGAAATADGEHLIIRSYSTLQVYRLTEGGVESVGDPADITALAEGQGEGIALAPDGTVVLVGEGEVGGTIARLRCTLPG